MTATRPPLTTLEGKFIRLDPMTTADLPDLHAAIGHPEVYAGGYGGGPAGYRASVPEFVEWAKEYFPWDARNMYLIRVNGGPDDGLVIGTTTLGDFEWEAEHAHIGWTAYDPRVWGGPVNPEAKYLLLKLAFEHGFGRVKIQTDVLNDRSRAAVLKLGAKFEGVVRRDRLRADGTWRDTAVYSILIDEWPEVRASLRKRLESFSAAPLTVGDSH